MQSIAIEYDDISKLYRIYENPQARLKNIQEEKYYETLGTSKHIIQR